MSYQYDSHVTVSTTTKQATTVGIIGDTDWDSVIHIEDFISEIIEVEEEIHGEESLQEYIPHLIVRETGTTGAEDIAMHIADKYGWNITCTKIPDAKTALKQLLKTADVVMVFLKHGTRHILPEQTLREIQKENPHLRIKIA